MKIRDEGIITISHYIYCNRYDSRIVLNEMRTLWSIEIQSYIRYSLIMIRSVNDTAVFDMNDHHRINQEALIYVISLSNRIYLIH